MDARPRLLLIGPPPGSLGGSLSEADVEHVPADFADVARLLQDGHYEAVVAAPGVMADMLDRVRRDELVLGNIDRGLAVLDPAGVVGWANALFRSYCTSDPVGRPLLAALGDATVVPLRSADTPVEAGGSPDPVAAAAAGQAVVVCLYRPRLSERPYLEVAVRPVFDPSRNVTRLVVQVRDVSDAVNQQRKLDALHAAGRELAGLDPDQLSEMNVPSRVELLKLNLRRYIRDLLHYDTIEVRLLDRKSGELKPLLEDGMTAAAAGRSLHASPEGNGVTGYVAFTGQSYLCPDTAADPRYIEGAEGARSSLTVPLQFHDEVIGTLNVESPRTDAFGPDDLQFTELFSKEVAAALHTLDLLNAQSVCTASQSVDAINREIALPIDDLLASASVLLGRLTDGEDDANAAGHLRRILDKARSVKESIARVGREMVVAPAPGPPASGDGGPPLAGRRVLVVDPDERTRKSAHLLLGRLGAEVETAGTGAEGLALAADNDYDAILLDIKPPDMGGYEAYRRFRAARPGSSLALTTGFGYDVAHSIVKARQEGMRHVLFKPFKPEQVVKAVLDTAPGSAPTPLSAPRPEVAGMPAL